MATKAMLFSWNGRLVHGIHRPHLEEILKLSSKPILLFETDRNGS